MLRRCVTSSNSRMYWELISISALKFLVNFWRKNSKTVIYVKILTCGWRLNSGDSKHFGFRVLILFQEKMCLWSWSSGSKGVWWFVTHSSLTHANFIWNVFLASLIQEFCNSLIIWNMQLFVFCNLAECSWCLAYSP